MQLDLNPEFQKAFEIAEMSNKNLFLTGKAGTGKSTFLRYFVQNTKKRVVVLAPTGVSALNVNGETIHSFFRLQPHVTEKEVISKSKRVKKGSIYANIDTIVIDEISMVRADLLDYIDLFLRIALESSKPFGGIQMIFIGDLYQLPPVVNGEEKEYFANVYKSPYFFDSNVMANKNFELKILELEKIYRQSEDSFIDILNAIRNNSADERHLEKLNSKIDSTFESSDFVTLTPTNASADKINNSELAKLEGKATTYVADIHGEFKNSHFPTEERLILKKGAKVMFLNNDSSGRWVNGTMGKVVNISKKDISVQITDGNVFSVEPYKWEVKKYLYDENTRKLRQESVGTFLQMPLKLAWALTIHKSQGKTFDKVILDIGRGVFAHGQTYVALSRCRSFDGLILKKEIKKQHLWVDYKVVAFMTSFQYQISEKNMPIADKERILIDACKEGREVEIIYLKAQDVKSKRKIRVLGVGEEIYQGKTFLGVRAFCELRKEERVFRIDRILEIFE